MSKIISKYLNKRNAWIAVALVCVSLISIGHAALNTTLSISGTATARAKSDIRVSNLVYKSASEGGSEEFSSRYSKETTTTGVILPNENSTVTYTVTIHNYSDTVYLLEEIQTVEDSNTDITYTFSPEVVGESIEPDQDLTFDITFTGSSSDKKNKSLILKYIFKENAKYLLYEKVLADNVINSATPDYSSTDTSTGALYKATDNLGDSYYFRGNVTNNYVLFAGFYWRIVRINGNNSVRLIYQGTTADANGTISSGAYNSSSSTRYHSNVRYFYNSGPLIRTTIDSWYSSNLSSVNDYMDTDAGYCNDYSTSSGSYGDSTSTSDATFSGSGRLSSSSPSLSCSSTYYITPSTSSSGTKQLSYPIATITMDEVMMAGGSSSNNTNYYMYTGTAYHTMTPYSFNYTSFLWSKTYTPSVIYADTDGKLTNTDTNVSYGYRPVINLASYIYWEKGNGTAENPYIPKLEVIPTYQFTVNPTPSDANVVIKVNGTVVTTSTGQTTVSAEYKDSVTYEVTKDGYYSKSGSYTMGKEEHSINVTLLQKSTVLASYIEGLYENADDKEETSMSNTYGYIYSASTHLRDDRLGGTVSTTGNIRYSGADPDNYVYFNCSDYSNQSSSTCETWRIIGVFDGKVKLVRQIPIGTLSWTSNSGTTINKWDPDTSNNYTGAAIMNLMNPGYESLSANNSLYWNAGSGNCYTGSNLTTSSCDFTSTGLKNDETRNLISTEKYYLYCPASGELYADKLYVQERGGTNGSMYDGSDDSPSMSRNGYWEGKIGLLYPSDHAYGATPGSCTLPLYNWASACLNSDWLAYSEVERLLTPSYKQSKAWYANKIGTLAGHVKTDDAAEAKNVRPVLYLYASQEFTSGDGTSSNPFKLKVN